MGKRTPIWLVALVVAAVGGIALLLLRSHASEPVYKGKRLSSWLRDASYNDDADAQKAIRAIGTNSLPFLIRMMQAKDSQLKRSIMRLVGEERWVNIGFERASDLHWRAAHGCSILRSEARPAIPALMGLLQGEEGSLVAPEALVRIGPDGVRALIGGLTNANVNVRHNIAAGLADIGISHSFTKNAAPEQMATFDEEVNIAVPALMKLLRNKADRARGQSAVTLGVIGVQPETVVPALIAILQDANNSEDELYDAITAASALGKFRHKAVSAVPALVLALKNPSPRLQADAASALKEIDPQAATKAGVK